MTTWFVTRHPGAAEWAQRKGLQIDRHVAHLDPAGIAPGDTVIGILPVHLAAQLCARGARYLNLSLDLPAAARGRELSAEELDAYGARIEGYEVRPEGLCDTQPNKEASL
ncbi:CRISPR-associated protein Csx16 [Thauera sp. WH-1]|uniref:CRISPR-associated protein Csx16 n=1 Tax=Thauera sp. WH-1 TaxID=3398230 RepID=UPI0039FCE096